MVPATPQHRNPIAYYGWLRETHGIFVQVNGVVHFRASETDTEPWQAVDLTTLTTWVVLNGRLDLMALQQRRDERFGSLYALIEYQNTEHAKSAYSERQQRIRNEEYSAASV